MSGEGIEIHNELTCSEYCREATSCFVDKSRGGVVGGFN